MATAVASRFAVLSIDDDDDPTTKVRKPKKKEDGKQKQSSGSGTSQQKSSDPKKKNKSKKKTESTNPQANGPSKAKKGSANGTPKSSNQGKGKKAPAGLSAEQWEEWKKKDQAFVSDVYEHDMHEAVLQSKLDFENQRKLMIADDDGQPPGGKGSRKRNKPQTMSLEQFNNPQKEEEQEDVMDDEDEMSEESRLFFEQVNEDARRAIRHELLQEQTRVRQSYVQEAVTISQFQDVVEKRDREIETLKQQVERLQAELKDVRARNSKLCTILAQGEMKDKVGALLEVERLQAERNDLLLEVQSLSTQLEQERSKVHALTSSMDKKTKGKKKTSESGQ